MSSTTGVVIEGHDFCIDLWRVSLYDVEDQGVGYCGFVDFLSYFTVCVEVEDLKKEAGVISIHGFYNFTLYFKLTYHRHVLRNSQNVNKWKRRLFQYQKWKIDSNDYFQQSQKNLIHRFDK